jgi:hypothetical protein
VTTDGASRGRSGDNANAPKVDLLTNHQTSMTFIQQFEMELRRKYDEAQDDDVLFRWICEKVLESYRNGITAGQKGAVVKRHGKSRGRDSFGKAE